jgi:RNA polymerase sigma factor (sigma-70 family)
MTIDQSFTEWMGQVRGGNEDAARDVWERYFRDLVMLARHKLNGMPRKMEDEEDVVASAFDSFFRAAQKGRFPELSDPQNLWRILSRLTERKAIDVIRRNRRVTTGGGRVRGDVSAFPGGGTTIGGLARVPGEELTPDMVVMLTENCRRLLDELDDDQLRQMAQLKLEGYSNEELAEELDCSLRTIERRLRLIRKKWEQELAP